MKSKILIISIIIVLLSSMQGFATNESVNKEPIFVGENFFQNTCEKSDNYFMSTYCQYFCIYCIYMNGNGACNQSGVCC